MTQDDQRKKFQSEDREPSSEGAGNGNDDNAGSAGAEAKAPSKDDPYRGPGGEPKQPPREDGEANNPIRDGSRRRILIYLGLFVLLLGGGLIGYGVYTHDATNKNAQTELDQRKKRVPQVRVLDVKETTEPREIHLAATTQAFESATIFARQSGYIAQRLVDIGSKVKSRDLLAVIAAPEVDDQLNQARAQLQQFQASLEQSEAQRALAQVTNNRSSPLVQQGWETKQTGDQNRLNLAAQNAAVDIAKANIEAQKASIARLERAQSYERVTAPFDGSITQRNIDVGSLVTADQTSGTPLFSVARVNVLRVQVYVPQDVALQLRPGVEATLEVSELPGKRFTGKVARTAGSLDMNTRTLLVEADIDNPDGTLTAGLYGTVRFSIPRTNPIIIIPSNALLFNQSGLQVATVEDGKAHIQKVEVGEDNGATVQIVNGLKANSQIIVAPPANLTDNMTVEVTKPSPPQQKEANKT